MNRDLPRGMSIVRIPPHSELARHNRESARDMVEREIMESVEKMGTKKDVEIKVDERMIDALGSGGIAELEEEEGLVLGRDYEITDSDEIQLIHTEPLHRRRRSRSSDDEFPDAMKIKRRERKLKQHSKSWTPR